MVYILGIVGVVVLIYGGELMVRGSKRLAILAGLSSAVIGLTVVAFGTSAPELAVTSMSTLKGNPGIALGNVNGSNIANIALILGCTGMFRALAVGRKLLVKNVWFMIGFSLLTVIMALTGELTFLSGVLLVAALMAFLIYSIKKGKDDPSVAQEETVKRSFRTVFTSLVLIISGVAGLVIGSNLMVEAAVELAKVLGVSDKVIGLTVVAVGTSLPELTVSLVSALKGETDMAIGNIVGSNIWNLGGVLGLALCISPQPIPVPPESIRFELPVMAAFALILLPIVKSKMRIDRWEAGLLFIWYILVITRTVLAELQPAVCGKYDFVLYAFVLPLTVIPIAWTTISISRSRSIYQMHDSLPKL